MPTVALIGCGRIAHLLEADALRYKPCTHLGALRYWAKKNKNIHLAYCCDSDLDRAKKAADFFAFQKKAPFVIKDPTAIFEARPDILIIASTTHTHFELIRRAVAAKIKTVIVEKPVCITASEANELKRLVKKSKTKIAVNYERRYHAKYQKLKRLIQNNNENVSYRALLCAGGNRLTADLKTANEGVLLHDTTHLLDLAQYLFGQVRQTESILQSSRHILNVEHTDGATGSIETVLNAGVFHFEIEIRLSHKRICVGNGFWREEKIISSPHYKKFRSYGPALTIPEPPMTIKQNPFVRLYQDALGGSCSTEGFFEACENVRILTRVGD